MQQCTPMLKCWAFTHSEFIKAGRSVVTVTGRRAYHFFRRTWHSEDENEQACGEELPYEQNSSENNVAHVSKIILKISLERKEGEPWLWVYLRHEWTSYIRYVLYLIWDVVPVKAERLHFVILWHNQYCKVIARSAEEEKDHTGSQHSCPAKAGPLQHKRDNKLWLDKRYGHKPCSFSEFQAP